MTVIEAVGIVALVFILLLLIIKWIFKGEQCNSKTSMEGKTVVITGANAGIGKMTAYELSERGARVIMACRNLKSAHEAVADIRTRTMKGSLNIMRLDLSSLSSVRNFCKQFNETERRLDVLINNAGLLNIRKEKTEDGFELCFGVNHLGHFLLTNLLLEKMKKSTPSRIVVLSSNAMGMGKIDFDNLNSTDDAWFKLYANSKLANAFFAQELSHRLECTGVNSYCVHPGLVKTEIGRELREKMPKFLVPFTDFLTRFLMRTTLAGAQTSVFCAVSDEAKNHSGRFYYDCKELEYYASAKNDGVAKKLWELSEELVGL